MGACVSRKWVSQGCVSGVPRSDLLMFTFVLSKSWTDVVATVTKLLSFQMLPPASVAWNENPNIGLWEPFPDFYQRSRTEPRRHASKRPFMANVSSDAIDGLKP